MIVGLGIQVKVAPFMFIFRLGFSRQFITFSFWARSTDTCEV